jgi:hypothetical protein
LSVNRGFVVVMASWTGVFVVAVVVE